MHWSPTKNAFYWTNAIVGPQLTPLILNSIFLLFLLLVVQSIGAIISAHHDLTHHSGIIKYCNKLASKQFNELKGSRPSAVCLNRSRSRNRKEASSNSWVGRRSLITLSRKRHLVTTEQEGGVQ